MAKNIIHKISVLLALVGLLGISTTAANAATYYEIQSAQWELQTLGYQPGEADGLMGPRTRAAIKAYQKDNALPTTGTLGPRTKAQLLQNVTLSPLQTTQRRRPGEKKRQQKARQSTASSRQLTETLNSNAIVPAAPAQLRRRPGANN